MIRFIGLLILLSSVLLAACQQAPQTLTDVNRAEIERAITDRVDELINAVEKVDLDRIVAWFEEDVAMGDNGSLYKTLDEILTVFRPGFEGLREQEINLSYSKVTVLAPDVAIMSGEGVFTATDTTGVITPERPFAWTFVFIEENGEWKYLQAHQSFGPSR